MHDNFSDRHFTEMKKKTFMLKININFFQFFFVSYYENVSWSVLTSCSDTKIFTSFGFNPEASTQCAAVNIVVGPMIVPPQNGNVLNTLIPTCHGMLLTWATVKENIFFKKI